MIQTGLNPPTVPKSESGPRSKRMTDNSTLTHIVRCAMRIHVPSLTDKVIICLPITDPEYRTEKLPISSACKIDIRLRDVLNGKNFARKQRSLHLFHEFVIPRYGPAIAVLGLVRWFGCIQVPMLETDDASMKSVSDDRPRWRSYH